MKTVGKIAFYVVLVGLAGLALYGAYIYILPRWRGCFFYAYCGLGLIPVGFGMRAIVRDIRTRSLPEKVMSAARQAAVRHSLTLRLNQIRLYCEMTCKIPAVTFQWPVAVISGQLLIRQGLIKQSPDEAPRLNQVTAAASSNLTQHYYPLYGLLFAVAVCAMEFWGIPWRIYGVIFLSMMLAAVMSRHLAYAVAVVPLPAELRRVTKLPYVAFLGIMAIDFCTLVLILTTIGRPSGARGLAWSDLKLTSDAIIAAQEPLKLLKGTRITFHQLIVGVAGLLFYLALAKTIWAFKEFKRTDEDHVAMANSSIALGRFSLALRYLNEVQSWSADAHSAKARALLGVNEVELALKETRAVLELQHKEASVDRIYLLMGDAMLLAPIPGNVVLEVIGRSILAGFNDVYLSGVVMTWCVNEERQTRLAELLLPHQEAFPLTRTVLSLTSRDLEGALAIVENIKCTEPLQEIGRLWYLLQARCANPETSLEQDSKTFQDWAATSLPEIKTLARSLKESIHCVFAFGLLRGVIRLAGRLGPERLEELNFLCETVKARTAEEAELMRTLEALMER